MACPSIAPHVGTTAHTAWPTGCQQPDGEGRDNDPPACVGGADRADEQVVVYNCGYMLSVSIGPSLLDGLREPYIL